LKREALIFKQKEKKKEPGDLIQKIKGGGGSVGEKCPSRGRKKVQTPLGHRGFRPDRKKKTGSHPTGRKKATSTRKKERAPIREEKKVILRGEDIPRCFRQPPEEKKVN